MEAPGPAFPLSFLVFLLPFLQPLSTGPALILIDASDTLQLETYLFHPSLWEFIGALIQAKAKNPSYSSPQLCSVYKNSPFVYHFSW